MQAMRDLKPVSTPKASAPFMLHSQRWHNVSICDSLLEKRQQRCHKCITNNVSCKATMHLQASIGDLTGRARHPTLNGGRWFHQCRKPNCYPMQNRCNRHLRLVPRAEVSLAAGLDVINDLGLDTLTFLAATVVVVPTFKAIKASPILGFFISGVVLNQLGLIRNILDVKALSELGILFLLFEMGLELSLARLRALAKFAFGMGLLQVLFSTLAFTAFELPPNGAVGTKILEFLFHSRPDLVNIRTIDEAIVIGAALSLSSSAFVLQLLAEKGELPTRFGSATLGILLFQDIAVVPLLVILPILESGTLEKESVWPLLAAESLKALGGLGVLSLGGQIFLRRIFEVVADSRSGEAFNALCLLTVTGTSLVTQKLGFSDTLGAFLAGALLAETNFRTQIEAEIRPFKGLLLGLFFVTTGTSIDIQLLLREWPNVLTLLGGLIAIKTAIITSIGPFVGLSLPESVRIGLLLSQGGEFAFVVFSLANRLGVLPLELNRLLIIVVVLSMSLTPLLNEVGQKAAQAIEARFNIPQDNSMTSETFEASDPVVIIGFGQMGQVLANFLSTPLASGLGGDSAGWRFVAFDLDPGRVKAARKSGFSVLYGDGSRPAVLQTAGITMPKAVMVMYTDREKSVEAVERLRLAFPGIPIYARAEDLSHLLELKSAGATDAILENTETSLQLGSVLLRGLGVLSDDVSFLTRVMRESLELRARVALERQEEKDGTWLNSFQAKVRQSWDARMKKQNLREPRRPSPKLKLQVIDSEAVFENEINSNGSLSEHKAEPKSSSEGHDLIDSVDSRVAQNFIEVSTANISETSLVSSSADNEVKVPWHQRMNFSSFDPGSGSVTNTSPDARGVTWCALSKGDSDNAGEDHPDEDTVAQSAEYISTLE